MENPNPISFQPPESRAYMVILLERINIQTVSTSGKQANGFLQTVACPTLTSDRGEVYFQRYDKIRQWNFVSWSDSPVTIIRKDMYIFLNPQLGVEECGSQPGDFTANTASDHLVSYKIIFIFWCFSCDSSKSLLMFLLFISSTSMDTGVQQSKSQKQSDHWALIWTSHLCPFEREIFKGPGNKSPGTVREMNCP